MSHKQKVLIGAFIGLIVLAGIIMLVLYSIGIFKPPKSEDKSDNSTQEKQEQDGQSTQEQPQSPPTEDKPVPEQPPQPPPVVDPEQPDKKPHDKPPPPPPVEDPKYVIPSPNNSNIFCVGKNDMTDADRKMYFTQAECDAMPYPPDDKPLFTLTDTVNKRGVCGPWSSLCRYDKITAPVPAGYSKQKEERIRELGNNGHKICNGFIKDSDSLKMMFFTEEECTPFKNRVWNPHGDPIDPVTHRGVCGYKTGDSPTYKCRLE